MADFVSGEGHTILLAFWMTVKVSALSAAGSLVLGTVLAAMRVAPLPVLRSRLTPNDSASSLSRLMSGD